MNRTFAAAFLFVAIAAFAQQPPAPLPPEVGNAVLLATNSIQVDRDVVVTRGDLVVNNASTGPVLGERDLSLDQGVQTPAGYALKANSIDLDQSARIAGDVYVNLLQNGGSIAGAIHTPVTLPFISTLPQLPPFQAAGTQNITLANGETRPLGTGVYGNLSIGRDATLRIPGGPYVFASITAERGASIIWDGPGDIVVNGNVTLGASTTIAGAPPVTTKHKMILVRGAVSIGKSSTIGATVFAPSGTIDADQSLTLTGSFVARNIHIGREGTLTLRSGFRNLPPVADDQSVAVRRDPVVITLTGSDPDDDPLTFSVGVAPSHGTLGAIVPAGPTSATVIYTPNANSTGDDTFTFRVTDSEGFFDDGVVTINNGIDLPGPPTTIIALAATVEVQPNVPAIIPLNAIGPQGVAITLSIVPDSGPAFGSLGPLQQPSNDPPRPGSVVYAPRPGFTGEDSFFFRACGTINGEEVCADARIIIAVVGPDSAGELAPDQTVATTTGAMTPILLVQGDPPDSVFRITSLPANGRLLDSNGAVISAVPYVLPSAVVTYQSFAGFSGTNTFAYSVTAGQQSDTGTVTVNVVGEDNGR